MSSPAVAERVTIRVATVSEIRRHHGLLEQHWDEVATDKRLMVLDPDWVRYQELEDAGAILALTVLVGTEVVGYSVNLIHSHIHYRSLKLCQNDVLFVTPAARKKRVGLALIHETELLARERGCHVVLMHCKPGTAMDVLMPRLGYRVQDIVYLREIR